MVFRKKFYKKVGKTLLLTPDEVKEERKKLKKGYELIRKSDFETQPTTTTTRISVPRKSNSKKSYWKGRGKGMRY